MSFYLAISKQTKKSSWYVALSPHRLFLAVWVIFIWWPNLHLLSEGVTLFFALHWTQILQYIYFITRIIQNEARNTKKLNKLHWKNENKSEISESVCKRELKNWMLIGPWVGWVHSGCPYWLINVLGSQWKRVSFLEHL